jgi:hypothetical protein
MWGSVPTPIQGAGTLQANSQLVAVPMSGAFYPGMASAPFYKGSGQAPPTVSMNYLGGSTNNSAAAAAASPFSFATSPLPIAIIGIAIGLIGLRYVHWRS